MKSKDKLRVYWSKRENDIILHHPLGLSTRCDAHWLSGIFNDKFIEAIKNRGYDPKTIKFEVCPQKGNERFVSERRRVMDNKIINEIKNFAAQKLQIAYGFCGVRDNPELVILNSNDREGKDITITIKLADE